MREYIWSGYLFQNLDSADQLAKAQYKFAKKTDQKWAMADALLNQGIVLQFKGNMSASMEYFQKGLDLSRQNDAIATEMEALLNIGVNHILSANYAKAININNEGMKLAEDIGDLNRQVKFLSNTGSTYFRFGDYPKALEKFIQSLNISEKIGASQKVVAASLGNIGNIYRMQGDFQKALEYYQRGLIINEELGDQQGISNAFANIGNIHNDLSEYTLAEKYYNQSLKIRKQLGLQNEIAHSLQSIGALHSAQKNYTKSIAYHYQSLEIKEQLGDIDQIASSHNHIGVDHIHLKDYSKALKHCKKGLELGQSVGSLEVQKTACQCLYDTYKAMNRGNEALVYLEIKETIEDSLNVKETVKQLQKMEFDKVMAADSLAAAESEQLMVAAHQEEVRKKNKTRNMFAGAGFIVLLLAGGLFVRVRFMRKSKAALQSEKDRSESLLHNILPADIAAELKEKGKVEARNFDMVSILFTDFKGFTAASSNLSASDLVKEINVCFQVFDGIMEKYDIEKIKTIGDAYMAAGGFPSFNNESTKNTVLAALEMQEFISQRKVKMTEQNKHAFEMRVGIHTGPVVAGIVGVKKFQYDIWGDTVNTAARMESSGQVGKVNISETTYKLIKQNPQFHFENRGKIEAKGKGEIYMHFVSRSTAFNG